MPKQVDKEELFCREYMISLDVTDAYIKAGFSKATANSNAYKFFAKESVQKRIRELMAERNKRLERTADDVYKDLLAIKDSAMQKIQMQDKLGNPIDKQRMIDYTNAIKAIDTELKFFVTTEKERKAAGEDKGGMAAPQINIIMPKDNND